MFLYFSRKERRIRKLLRKIARQRVIGKVDPNTDVWIIEKSPDLSSLRNQADIKTCLFRGWVEPLDSSNTWRYDPKKNNLSKSEVETKYRLTESGWKIIRSEYIILLLVLAVSIMTMVLPYLLLFLKLYLLHSPN